MKIAIIGDSGHGRFCLPDSMDRERDFVGIAPGSSGEFVDSMLRKLRSLGYAPALYTDYRELLRRERPDIVVVDNYYGEHCGPILEALRAGCHVFAEKPAAASLEQLDRIREAHRRAGTVFVPMFNYRYDGAFYRAWSLIREGAVGEVRLLSAQKSYKLGKRPRFMESRDRYGGTIPWVGIHAIDWILWMSGGRFTSVWAAQSAMEAANGVSPETTAAVLFRMEGGQIASLTVDYLNPEAAPTHGDDRIRVAGTKGVLEVRQGTAILTDGQGVRDMGTLEGGDLFEDFLLQIAGKGRCRVSAEDAFAAERAAILARQAADLGEICYF